MRRRILQSDSGSAMLVVIAVLMLATLIGLQMFSVTSDDMTISFNRQGSTKAFYAAESGQAMAQSKIWWEYINTAMTLPPKAAGDIGSRASYTQFLNDRGIFDGQKTTITAQIDLGNGDYIEAITVSRDDQPDRIVLSISTTGHSLDKSTQTIDASYHITGAPFKGFEFAILANNINCIMCHATIDNVDRVYNNDTSLVNTFERVKVAALESMLIRTSSADSRIAGTLYTRGIITDKNGNVITNLSPTGTGLGGFDISSTDGHIIEPMNSVPLVNTSGSPPSANGNLYINYPSDPAMQTDGALPNSFPPPFPDKNGNRIVDLAEFNEVAGNATGMISGGVIYGVATGGTYASGFLPPASNMGSVSQQYTGNLILVGTTANPIEINQDVVINGDVVIQGVIKGSGQIYATGNVYITGDLTYADGVDGYGNRTYGRATDGTRNALSIASGQNVLVSDYLTRKIDNFFDPNAVDPGNLVSGEKFSFAMSEMTLFNRAEWAKTQPQLRDESGTLVANSGYQAGYKPRYYTMNDGDPVYVYNKKDTWYDPVTNSWKGKEHASDYDMTLLSKFDSGDPELTNAVITPLSSTSNWISPSTLKKLWINDEAARSAGDEFKIDGQIYTSNSIFTLSRGARKTMGKMTVNGALVAADIGVLVGNGLNLNYDKRLKEFLKIEDDSEIMLVQGSWYAR